MVLYCCTFPCANIPLLLYRKSNLGTRIFNIYFSRQIPTKPLALRCISCKFLLPRHQMGNECVLIMFIFLQIPSTEIDKSTDKFFSYWDPDKKSYIVSFSIHVLPFCLAAFISTIGFTTFDLFLETDATILQAKTTGG
jgi:hypothetical protein